jgi:opacity protein-like surface antigen
MSRWILGATVASLPVLFAPGLSAGQALSPSALAEVSAGEGTDLRVDLTRWELTLDGQAGVPSGHLQVGETNAPGTRLRLRDLGIDRSEAVQLSAAYHFTQQDALRATFLYSFLDGSANISHPIVYNGQTSPAGRVHANADFWRATVAYERDLLTFGGRGRLIGSAGLTYVYFNPTVNGNNEDFYLQELPVPVLGGRIEYPLGDRLNLTVSVAGGLLPRVDSLRKEGGTVYLQQSHADLGLGISYALTPAVELSARYQFTYFTQHELSHEDNNAVELLDSGLRVGLKYRF